MDSLYGLQNQNSLWLNLRGSWTMHFIIIAALRFCFSIIPGINNDMAWTLTVQLYNMVLFLFSTYSLPF